MTHSDVLVLKFEGYMSSKWGETRTLCEGGFGYVSDCKLWIELDSTDF